MTVNENGFANKAGAGDSFPGRSGTNFRRPVYCLLGLPFDAITLVQAVTIVQECADRSQRCFLSTPNLNFAITSLKDTQFRNSVLRSDLSLVDGMPLVWIARLLGIPIKERVAGANLFESLRSDTERHLSVYFFGGPDRAAETACNNLNLESGGLSCVGFCEPGFGDVEMMSRPDMIERINASEADFLVVALGARKGQAWIERNFRALTIPVISHLGAVVNFVAGTVDRAPKIIQNLGLEWLWRIKEEPGIWRRYWCDGVALLQIAVTTVLRQGMRVIWFDANRKGQEAMGTISFEREKGVVITLAGVWKVSHRAKLATLFENATQTRGDIKLDLAHLVSLDSGCIAQLMLLYGHQSKINAGFVVVSTQKRMRRLLRFFCADFLIDEPLVSCCSNNTDEICDEMESSHAFH